jgi:drug/metabolite transporter (DMT)-like permease
LPASQGTWLAVAYLILGSSVGVFFLYVFILGRWTATGASYSFVLNPIVTVILAALLAGETVTPVFIVGTALVLVGVWVSALMPARKPKTPVKVEIQERECMPNCF